MLAVLVGLLIAAVAALVVGTSRGAQDRADDAQRAAILRSARQQAVNLTTIDAEHIDRDVQRILDGATGDFRAQFEAGSKDLTEVLATSRSVSKGEVLEAGIVTSDSDSAQVLVVVDSTVTNAEEPKGRLSHYRMQLDLVRQGGRWLTSNLEFR